MHTYTHSHRAIYPIISLIGRMPRPGEDVDLLVKCALEAQAVREEKEIGCSFQLLRTQEGKLTGEVELFPFSPIEEELYLAELYSKYEEDPLEDLHWHEPDVRDYQKVKLPGGDVTVSCLVKVKKTTPR